MSSTELTTQLTGALEGMWPTISMTVSEAAGQMIGMTSSGVEVKSPVEIQQQFIEPQLCMQFSFSDMPEGAVVVLLSEDTVALLAGLLKEGDVGEIDENLIAECRPILDAIVQGMCVAVGNIRSQPVVAGSLTVRFQAVSLPPNVTAVPEVVVATAGISTDQGTGSLVWVLDIATAQHAFSLQVAENDTPFPTIAGAIDGGNAAAAHADDASSLEIILDIPLEISVELGRMKMMVKDILELGTGAIVEIDKAAGEPVDVMVNGRLVARGEVVVIEDNFGVRITEILSPQERLAKLGEVA